MIPTETVSQALASPPATPVDIADLASVVQSNIDSLQDLYAGDAANIGGLTFTTPVLPPGFGTAVIPGLYLSYAQWTRDSGILHLINNGTYFLQVAGTVAQALSLFGTPHVDVSISDSAANVQANIGSLATNALRYGYSISLTDSGLIDLSLTASQFAAFEQGEVFSPSRSHTIFTIDGSAANITVGSQGDFGVAVQFTGAAAAYALQPMGDGVHFTVTSTGSTDHLAGVQALQFADTTDFVASQTPLAFTSISSAEVVTLYAAALGRKPDLAGLVYYETLALNGLTLSGMAQDFLRSPEYSSAHAYAASSAGDAQFIADTYNTLLHRAPESGAVAYYQTVINGFTAGLTPGSAAYADAQIKGHAQVLVGFSASTEFLGDVQITAQHPSDPQHFLFLI